VKYQNDKLAKANAMGQYPTSNFQNNAHNEWFSVSCGGVVMGNLEVCLQ
jgi:hypothetical protein